MSYTFSVASPSPPALRELLESLDLPDLVIDEPPPDSAGVWRVHRDGLSTRALELSRDEDKLRARLLVCSSPDVARLALDLCERVAAQAGGLVEPEDDEPWQPGQRPERFAGDWPERELEHQARLIVRMVEQEDPPSPFTMSGPNRPFHIGLRLAGELRAGGPEAELPDRLLATMRRVQYAATKGIYAANVLTVSDRETHKVKYTVAVWLPGTAYLFPRVTYYHIVNGEESLRVPAEAGPAIAAGRHEWLDEYNCLVAGTPAAEWPELVARARPHAIAH